MALFLSTYVNKVDKKGRVSVPAHVRSYVGTRGLEQRNVEYRLHVGRSGPTAANPYGLTVDGQEIVAVPGSDSR